MASQRGSGTGRGHGHGRSSDQHASSPSSRAGRGRGRSGDVRSGGGGRGRCRSGPADTQSPAVVTQTHLSQTEVVQSTAQPQPPVVEAGSSQSVAVTQLTTDVERLTATETAPVVQPATLLPSSSKYVKIALRPGYGSLGTKCMVRANHFLVEVADRDLHHYDVTITPEVPKPVNREIMRQLVEMYSETHLNKRLPAYDGMKSLYTAGPLPFEGKEFVVELPDKDGSKTFSSRSKRQFKVEIKYAAKASIYHLQEFLSRRQLDAPHETIQALDVVLRQIPSMNFTVVGRSFFSMNFGEPSKTNDGFEYWKGYYQSIRPTQMGLSLNIDVSARAFYEPIIVSAFIDKYCEKCISKPLSNQNRIKAKQALKGIKVEVTHTERKRKYRVSGLSIQNASQLVFPLGDSGTQISVAQYYQQRYNLKLRYPWLPCLEAGSEKKRVCLPMEICKIVRGQRFTKKLNDTQVRNMLKATCQRPSDREWTIKQMVTQKLKESESENEKENQFKDNLVAGEFGMKVRDELTLVEARVLPPPVLKYKGSDCIPKLGEWSIFKKKLVNGGSVQNWTCVTFSELQGNKPDPFCNALVEKCIEKGLVFNRSPVIPFRSANPRHIKGTLVDIQKQLSAKDKQLQLLLVILPDAKGSYGTIKRLCETELGFVSQCIQPNKALDWNRQYLENVSLKINVKVGGRNTVLADAIERRIPHVSDRPTIIFGADVTHPSPGEDSIPSIAAVVASMDWPEVTKYRGTVSAQNHREEIIHDLYNLVSDPVKGQKHCGMIRDHMIAFRRATGHKPHRIIFYRDGVSEGQFSQVLLHEMDAIRKACASLEEGYLPPITFVVVQKRHHTRFFPYDHRNSNTTLGSGNILPGTVVDQRICHPTEFDFYLNSHAGIKGTSRPAHYHVLYDENKFTADQLQSLTNNLCYTYARCTKAVSVVPPAYYAHLVAFRARCYIEGNEWSDSGSGVGRSTVGAIREIKPLPAFMENVKDVMFYC